MSDVSDDIFARIDRLELDNIRNRRSTTVQHSQVTSQNGKANSINTNVIWSQIDKTIKLESYLYLHFQNYLKRSITIERRWCKQFGLY